MKSQTLYQRYYHLRNAMSAPTITPERRAELELLSLKLKQAAKRAELTETQQRSRDAVQTLRDHQQATGFRTTRGQNDILAELNGQDLAAVLQSLNEGVTRG